MCILIGTRVQLLPFMSLLKKNYENFLTIKKDVVGSVLIKIADSL